MTSLYARANCLEELPTAEYDYVYLGPPCYEDADNISRQMGGAGVDTAHPSTYKTEFIDLFIPLLKPDLGTITISFTGDRRNNSKILPKNFYVMSTMFENGYYLRSAKYALKSASVNLYSSNIIHVLTFQKDGMKGKHNLRKSNLFQTYGLDLWGPFKKEIRIGDEVVGQSPVIAQRCIKAFTDKNDIVLDPFAGIGTTLEVARQLERRYVGYEIRQEIWDYGKAKYIFL